jgi:hypothetical protein
MLLGSSAWIPFRFLPTFCDLRTSLTPRVLASLPCSRELCVFDGPTAKEQRGGVKSKCLSLILNVSPRPTPGVPATMPQRVLVLPKIGTAQVGTWSKPQEVGKSRRPSHLDNN